MGWRIIYPEKLVLCMNAELICSQSCLIRVKIMQAIKIIFLSSFSLDVPFVLSFSHVQLCDPMDCSTAGSSVHGIFPGKNTGMGSHFLLQGIFPTHGLNLHLLCLLQWQADSLPLCHLRSPSEYAFY